MALDATKKEQLAKIIDQGFSTARCLCTTNCTISGTGPAYFRAAMGWPHRTHCASPPVPSRGYCGVGTGLENDACDLCLGNKNGHWRTTGDLCNTLCWRKQQRNVTVSHRLNLLSHMSHSSHRSVVVYVHRPTHTCKNQDHGNWHHGTKSQLCKMKRATEPRGGGVGVGRQMEMELEMQGNAGCG